MGFWKFGGLFWRLLSQEKYRLNLSIAPWASYYEVCSSHCNSQYWNREGKPAPSNEGPVFTDADYQIESSLTSSSKVQVWALFLKYSQKINLPLDFSIDNTESLGNENKPSEKGLLSFPTSLTEGSFIAISILIDSRINVCIVAVPPSLCVPAVSL